MEIETTEAATTSTDKNKCEMCKESEHKYKCPACSLKTCSLNCCQAHKQKFNCSGQRDKTKFVKLQEFTERELINDYNFLEEQSRLVDNTQRDALKRKYDITPSMDYLKNLAFRQSKTVLQFMPRHSSKRLSNRTRFDKVTRIINWHLELKFSNDKLYTVNELCSSREKLKVILSQFYKDNEFSLFLTDQPLHEFQAAFKALAHDDDNHHDLNILYEIRNFTLKCKYYAKFDLEKSLEESLFKKTVIEYPTLTIVLSRDLSNYNIRDESDILRDVQKHQQENNRGSVSHVKAHRSDEFEEGECNDNEDEEEEEEDTGEIEALLEQLNGSDLPKDDTTAAAEEDEDSGETENKKQKFFTDEFDLEFEFNNLQKGLSEAGINIEKM